MPSEDFRIEMPFGPPPVLPELVKQFEEYLTKPEKLPLHNNKNDFRFWNREIDLNSLYDTDISPALTTLRIKQNFNTNELLQFDEILIEGIGETSKNSMSFSRPPGRVTDDILGSTTNCPFWPGGLDPPTIPEIDDADINLDTDLLSQAPGLSTAVDFISETKMSSKEIVESEKCLDTINFQAIMEGFGLSSVSTKKESEDNVSVEICSHELEKSVIPNQVLLPVLKISSTTSVSKTKTEWAELLDTTKLIVNFDKKIPDPAVNFNFELDTFQKMAILKLENHEHIFVAAHTSAGKTVVAEYAIGLSLKHGTKTIYTSPIKALSNQKYRDFKNKFDEVGLITGDFQVNQQAPCLIMTTEILRSMLYAGSDVIRDIEFVIFDEVHYINDSERGHVWEEIMIMLPDTVCIVMLSATVPNVLEFADWVGSTKKAKMFVVSTLKRPVPLQHFLYTGVESKNENLFLIKDAEGAFIVDGYNRAASSIEKLKADGKGGDKNKIVKANPLKPAFEKHYWIAFAKFLKKCDKLPAVAFTLSRSKCDRNAEYLMSIDLTTQTEKDYISYYFRSSIGTLKEEDRNLPQIVRMELLLSRGIAVHHSGILPILKEIVEILFQKSLVKFLFATETFAMGVNMPAKTVAFDSIKKYDGTCTRPLQPAEYIQMAGRAGRRGQDDTGTVIILCKHTIEPAEHLRSMMTGPPTKLESQFRMTYSMILNLLRVKRMRVEEIMLHSFKELHSRRQMKNYKKELEELNENTDHGEIKNKPFYRKLEEFYQAAAGYIELWDSYGVEMFSNPKAQKKLVPGTFIVISHKEHINKLALILHVNAKRGGVEYKVLILRDAEEEEEERKAKESNLFYRMIGLARKSIHVPGAQSKDLILSVGLQSIREITKFNLNLEFDLVIKDYEERQLPRFKNKTPSERYVRATTALSDRSYSIQTNGGLKGSNFLSLNDFKINDINLIQIMANLKSKKKEVQSFDLESEIPDFESQFKEVFVYLEKESRKRDLEYRISYESLLLYPDYQHRVNVLKTLKYIDDEEMVQMKGKVACGMGSHELIITELIFQNSLSKFEPAEIAALLSCLVFQVKMQDDFTNELSERLREGKKIIENVFTHIKRIGGLTDEAEILNFGLVLAVYEWAHGKPFAEIMSLVEGQVQEGIIVRCIQQLNEILRDIKDAAKLFGDQTLKVKMEEASDAIKRDIVFAASLYTQ